MGVLALQGDVREHRRALEKSGARTIPVRRPAELARVDGIVLPGGESTTISRLLDVFELRDLLSDRLAGGLPAYGSCAGMIMLATEILDARSGQVPLAALDITVRRNAFGRQVDSFEATIPVLGVPGEDMHAVFIRAPWVESVGDGVQVLAAVDGHPVAVRSERVLATSFHPEITGDTRIHRLFVEMVTDTRV
ncbi:pyridoxal 5'-phosphate synthase glutaminase subunit PdxT [Nakamurella silvestris]|nr:pyridoxal 5'-phosphate synthase glutaminase subunit PdxT [Nakamurella silvestris]